MLKLQVKQATVDYYGFFRVPAFNLIGETREIITGLSKTFAAHNVGLESFRIEGDGRGAFDRRCRCPFRTIRHLQI